MNGAIPQLPPETQLDRWLVPVLLTLALYGAMGGGMYGINEYMSGVEEPPREVVEVEFVEPPPLPPQQEPEPPPEQPELPPEEPELPPEPEPPPETKKIARVDREQPPPERRIAEPPPDELPDDPPAPGENTNNDLPAPSRVFRLPDQGPGGTIPVARGRTTGRRGGVEGGTGTNTGGGGPPTSKGTGVKPVSVTAVKRMPKPITGQDYASVKYPDEARRLGIEGQVKVRLVIDEQGKVAKVTLVKKLGHGLDEEALRLAKELRFEPALDQDDQAVTTAIVWTFSFTLPE